jgi:transcriptional regulator with XRE-family HTH domain
MITSQQMRAARALLGLDQRQLADLALVSLPTIQRMEASDGQVRGVVDTLVKVISALEAAGVELIGENAPSSGNGRGVRLRETSPDAHPTTPSQCYPVRPEHRGAMTVLHDARWAAYTPKLITVLGEGYSLNRFKRDAAAGLTVAIIALPLAMALGIASGVSPHKGLITAVIAGFLISALGGSRAQVGGPTGAFVVVVFDVIARHGYDGLLLATLLAGILLIVAGYAGWAPW